MAAFLCTVEEIAAARDDDELGQLVDDVRSDLATLSDERLG